MHIGIIVLHVVLIDSFGMLCQVATWAGNLMVKHRVLAFPSDLFVLLECIQAQICVGELPSGYQYILCFPHNTVCHKLYHISLFCLILNYNYMKYALCCIFHARQGCATLRCTTALVGVFLYCTLLNYTTLHYATLLY